MSVDWEDVQGTADHIENHLSSLREALAKKDASRVFKQAQEIYQRLIDQGRTDLVASSKLNKLFIRFIKCLFPVTEILIKHFCPCDRVCQGSLCDHTIEIKNDCLKMVLIHELILIICVCDLFLSIKA